MSDRDEPAFDDPVFDDPAFDDPAYDEVRALLGEARVTGPVPDEVAARLDATLAGLQAERRSGRASERPAVAAVVPLRRRLGRPLLVAAAVAAVIGTGTVGIAQMVRTGAGSTDAGATAGSASQSDEDAGADSLAEGGSAERSPAEASGKLEARLSSATFARDAARVMRSVQVTSTARDYSSQTPPTPTPTPGTTDGSTGDAAKAPVAPPVTSSPTPLDSALIAGLASCPGPRPSGAVTLSATLDGAPVALVFSPPTAAGQLVEAWSCDGSTRLASATIPH